MLRLARKQALLSTFHRARVGAVVVRGGRVLSVGHNQIRYTKHIKRPYPESLHAEQAAILKLLSKRKLSDLVGSTMFVCRIDRRGIARLARPCANCQNLIDAVGIKEVVYTT